MAFPTSSLTNNQVHKEGNRAFVYDSALGVWDQVRETDRTENKILSGEIGAGVTGLAGIKHSALWRMHTEFTGGSSNVDPIVNWERDDTYSNGFVGSDMTESGGIFSFPETGVWDIHVQLGVYFTDATRYIAVQIFTTSNNGSGWDDNALGETSIGDSGSSNVMGSMTARTLFNVSATGTHKCKFVQGNVGSAAVVVRGTSTRNDTFVVFTRLGDM